MSEEYDDSAPSSLDELIENPEAFIAFESEVMLSYWKDTPDGMYVTFLIHPDTGHDSPVHPFKKFHAKGMSPQAGTRFWLRALELGDDDEPINQEVRDRVRHAMDRRDGQGVRCSKEAALLCRNPLFHAFVRDRLSQMEKQERKQFIQVLPHGLYATFRQLGRSLFDEASLANEVCKYFIYHAAKIRSRADLDKHPRKVLLYQSAVVEPFYVFREQLAEREAKERHQKDTGQTRRDDGGSPESAMDEADQLISET